MGEVDTAHSHSRACEVGEELGVLKGCAAASTVTSVTGCPHGTVQALLAFFPQLTAALPSLTLLLFVALWCSPPACLLCVSPRPSPHQARWSCRCCRAPRALRRTCMRTSWRMQTLMRMG